MLTAIDEGEEEKEEEGDHVQKVKSLKIWCKTNLTMLRSAYRSTTSPQRLARIDL